jgi:uncharacterized protein YndB with AHSA1/START domain
MKLLDLTVSREIDATAEEVFDAWTDPSKFGAWFGVSRLIMDPVVDGLYYIAVDYQNRIWPHYGRFLKIERPRLVEQTWMSEGTKGLESIVTFTIEPRGDRVQLTIRHSGVPDDEEGRRHEEGWAGLLEEIEKHLAEQRAGAVAASKR